MIPAATGYARAQSVAHAMALLAESGGEGRLIAGGHSLLPMMKVRMAQPGLLIDIAHLAGLRGIAPTAAGLRLGALTRHADIEHSVLVAERLPVLAQAAALIADPLVRNRGTIGGSVAHADPASDWPGILLMLDARFLASGPAGTRTLPAAGFFRGLFETALGPDEVLEAIEVDAPGDAWRAVYVKERHPASGYAVAGAAVGFRLSGGRVDDCRVAITGAAPAPFRARHVEAALAGRAPEPSALAEAARLAARDVAPMGDAYASSDYRGHLAEITTRRALLAVLAQARPAG